MSQDAKISVEEGNRIIAEFMGGTFKKVDYYEDGRIAEEIIFRNHPSQLLNGIGRIFSDIEDLRYHSSWDWLIPVWAKAGALSKKLAMDEDTDRHKRMCDLFERAVFQNKPEIAQQVIADFIQWYQSHSEGDKQK